MINLESIFAKQFEPFDDGYVFHSGSSGGRFVSKDEYDALRARYLSMVPRSSIIVAVGVCVAVVAKEFLDLPSTWATAVTFLLVVFVFAMMFWTSFAPARLVKGRPAVTPPKTVADMRRTARSMISWRTVVAMIVLSAIVLGGCLISPLRTLDWWLWTAGASTFLVGYVWIAICKVRDK